MKKHTEDTVPAIPYTVQDEVLCLRVLTNHLEKNPDDYYSILLAIQLQITKFLKQMH